MICFTVTLIYRKFISSWMIDLILRSYCITFPISMFTRYSAIHLFFIKKAWECMYYYYAPVLNKYLTLDFNGQRQRYFPYCLLSLHIFYTFKHTLFIIVWMFQDFQSFSCSEDLPKIIYICKSTRLIRHKSIRIPLSRQNGAAPCC